MKQSQRDPIMQFKFIALEVALKARQGRLLNSDRMKILRSVLSLKLGSNEACCEAVLEFTSASENDQRSAGKVFLDFLSNHQSFVEYDWQSRADLR